MIGYEFFINKPKTPNSGVGLEKDIFNEGCNSNLHRLTPQQISVLDSFNLDELRLGYNLSTGMEEDNPYAGIGEDISNDNFSDDGGFSDTGDGDTGDPFGGSDDGSDPFGETDEYGFGDDGVDENSGGEKKKKNIIERTEQVENKFNLSKIIRKDFPSYIHSLMDIARNAVEILEKKQHVDKDLNILREQLIIRYREAIKLIEIYLNNIDNEKYEDIFKNYVSFWSLFNQLKISSEKVLI